MKQAFVLTVRDALRTLGISAAACLIWLLLNRLGLGGLGLLLWALAVALAARLSLGYFWGAAVALLGAGLLALADLPGLGPKAGVWAVSCLCWLALAFLFGPAPAPAGPKAKTLAEPDLIRALAHDFRSPLTAISGALEAAVQAAKRAAMAKSAPVFTSPMRG